jgi:hypothetical protein
VSSHGAYDARLKHYIALSGGRIPRSALLANMEAGNAGNIVFLTNICSAIPVSNIVKLRKTPSKRNFVLEDLFFSSFGVTDITAATPPELAFGDLFGESFDTAARSSLERIDKDKDRFVTWAEFRDRHAELQGQLFKTAQAEAGRQSRMREQDGQNLRAFSLSERRTFTRKDRRDSLRENIHAAVEVLTYAFYKDKSSRGLRVSLPHTIRNYEGQTLKVTAFLYSAETLNPITDAGPFGLNPQSQWKTPEGFVGFTAYIRPRERIEDENFDREIPEHALPRVFPIMPQSYRVMVLMHDGASNLLSATTARITTDSESSSKKSR